MAWEWWPIIPDMKWTSAAVYGRRALSSLAFAMAARSLWLRATWDEPCEKAGLVLTAAARPLRNTAAARVTCGGLLIVWISRGGVGTAPLIPVRRYILPPGCRVVSSSVRSGIVYGCSMPAVGRRARPAW